MPITVEPLFFSVYDATVYCVIELLFIWGHIYSRSGKDQFILILSYVIV